jgi:predicted nucleic acid-binding protein
VLWLEGAFELVVSPKLLDETTRALAAPKLVSRVEPREAEAFVALLRERAELRADPPQEPPARSEDPGDDYLLVLAAAADTRLVSGDRHLLALAERMPVLSPRDFLSLIEQ